MAAAIHWDGPHLILRVQVQPRASHSEFAGLHGDSVKIRLTAPPVDGKANTALVAFLAEAFGVARRQVTLLAGDTGRNKRLRVADPARIPADLPVPPRPV